MQEYNAQGKVIRSTDLAGRVTTTGRARRPFRHARRGKKIANSATVHYSLLPIRCPDSTPSVVLCYDAMGRQTRAVDAAGITTFAYDTFGSLTNETVVGVAGTNTIERFYDAFGRDAGYALNGVRQSALSYDAATGRLATMRAFPEEANHHSSTSTSHFNSFRWSYLPGSDLKQSLTYPNGLTASWTYGNRGELLEVNNALADGSISKYAYTYDAAGRRVACAKSGTAFEQSDSVNYGYNARSELTNATAAVDSDYRYGYNFDDIGNRKSSAERGVWSSEYTANNLNQYTTITSQTARASEAVRNYYDADGNQIRVKTATGTWQVSYNGENRPVRWQQGPTVITMSFDRMGRRVTKNDRRFVYNGYLQIANFRSTTTTSDYNYFIWDPTERVATRPLVWKRGTSVAYYTHDSNKNVSEVIASNNDVAAHYEYAPFGALTVSRGTSAATNPWRFSSEYAEDDTATVYYNYRHYEPVTGRWMARDPIDDVDGDDEFICGYCYVANSVVEQYDRLGLKGNSLKPGLGNYTITGGGKGKGGKGHGGLGKGAGAAGGAGLALAGALASKWMDSCDSCPDGVEACLKCCDRAALAAHAELLISTALGNASCFKLGNPFLMVACFAAWDYAGNVAGDDIERNHRACGMRCIYGR